MAMNRDDPFFFDPTVSLPVLTEIYQPVEDAVQPAPAEEARLPDAPGDGFTPAKLTEVDSPLTDEPLKRLDTQLEHVAVAVAEALDSARDAARDITSSAARQGRQIQQLNEQLAAIDDLEGKLATANEECRTWQARAQEAESAKEALGDELLREQALTDEIRAERDALALQLRELESRRQEQDRTFRRLQAELQERDDELATLEARLTRLALVEDAVQEARHEAARDEFGVLVRTNGTTEIRYLDLPRMTIGREADNDLRIQESHISRHHAQITRIDDETFIEDLESTNGVYVNGQPVVIRLRVQDGDQVSIGGTEFRYQESMQA